MMKLRFYYHGAHFWPQMKRDDESWQFINYKYLSDLEKVTANRLAVNINSPTEYYDNVDKEGNLVFRCEYQVMAFLTAYHCLRRQTLSQEFERFNYEEITGDTFFGKAEQDGKPKE